MDFIILWQHHGSYTSLTIEEEKGLGAVQSEAGWAHVYACIFGHVFAHVGCLLRMKTHLGFLLRHNQKCQLMEFWQKRKQCGTTSEQKVLTCGFLAKKEMVWRDLSAILTCGFSAKKETVWCNLSAILTHGFSAKKETMWCDLSQKCLLRDFWWKRKWCGMTSLPFCTTCGFSAKKEGMWCDLDQKCWLVDFCQKWKPCGVPSKISLFQLMRYTFHIIFKQQIQSDIYMWGLAIATTNLSKL